MKNTLDPRTYRPLVKLAIAEDIGDGDVTAIAAVRPRTRGRAWVKAKATGVLCGLPVAVEVCRQVDRRLRVETKLRDGRRVKPGDRVLDIVGPARSILAAERIVLNFMQRMSGIATLTDDLASRIKGTRARVYDTRKTIPGYRALDKYAVRVGGGVNHRDGLFDQVLLKENHFIAAAAHGADFAATIRAAREHVGRSRLVEVETETLEQFRIAMAERADIIMLDDFSLADTRRAVAEAKKRRPRPKLEASGGITARTIRRVAETGVDRISIGALTHSVIAFDLALYMERDQ